MYICTDTGYITDFFICLFIIILTTTSVLTFTGSIVGGLIMKFKKKQSFCKGVFLGSFSGFIIAIVLLALAWITLPVFTNQ